MSYSTSLPGIDEARLDAIKTLIVNSLTDLNTALAVGTDLTGFALTEGQIMLGDPHTLTQTAICIVGGGEQDATDFETEQEFVNNGEGWGYTLHTNIYVYIHPEEFPGTDVAVQAAKRERARSRICDHLRKRVFNTAANVQITLASQEFYGTGDILTNCWLRSGTKGVTFKGFGETVAFLSANLLHTGYIA